MNKNLAIGLGILIVLVLGMTFPRGNTVIQQVASNLGANPGPDSFNECVSQNGLQVCKVRKALTTATTTPCAIKSPTSTSTLLYSSVMITTSTTTATTWTAAKAANAFATTTNLGSNIVLASGIQGVMLASTTVTALDATIVIAPNQFVVWGVAGTVISGTANLNGVCSAEFLVN